MTAVVHAHTSHHLLWLTVEDPRANGALTAIAWMIALLTTGYTTPWAVAVPPNTTNQAEVGLVNFSPGLTIWSIWL